MAFNISEQAKRDANLRLLQRKCDRSIVDILGSATHVGLYNFHQETSAWEKSNVEGSLFLAVRPTGYLLVILNRNSPDSCPIVVTKDFQLQLNDPYIIFRSNVEGNDNRTTTMTMTRGIWFPNANERAQMYDLLSHVLQDLRDNKPLPLAAAAAAAAPPPAAAAATSVVDPASATAALLASLNVSSSSATGQAAAAAAAAAASQQQQQQQQQQQSYAAAAPAAVAPGLRQASPSSAQQQPTLDKKSLQLALLSLIQDERFLDLLHAQYLKVHHTRSSRNNNNNSNGSGNGSS